MVWRILSLILLSPLFLAGCSSTALLQTEMSVSQENHRGNFKAGKESLSAFLARYPKSPDSVKSLINARIGVLVYKAGDSPQAERLWKRAAMQSQSKTVKSRMYYDIGVSQFKRGDATDAFTSFKRSLLYDPSSRLARENLEILIKSISQISLPGGGREPLEQLSTDPRKAASPEPNPERLPLGWLE